MRIPETYRRLPAVSEILEHPDFEEMKYYQHHGDISCLEHTLRVVETACALSATRGADTQAVIRGALLHDFYLYDWHGGGPSWHGFRHPLIAAREAAARFELSSVERDCIIKHMFPLTPVPPSFRESWIVNLADKINAVKDYRNHFYCLFRRRFYPGGCGTCC